MSVLQWSWIQVGIVRGVDLRYFGLSTLMLYVSVFWSVDLNSLRQCFSTTGPGINYTGPREVLLELITPWP